MGVKLPQPGELDRYLRFSRRLRDDEAADGVVLGDYVPVFERWASHVATRGGELTVGDRLAGVFVYDLKCRADPDTDAVTPGWRVTDITDADTGQVFDIKSVQFLDANRFWILMQTQALTGQDGRNDQ